MDPFKYPVSSVLCSKLGGHVGKGAQALKPDSSSCRSKLMATHCYIIWFAPRYIKTVPSNEIPSCSTMRGLHGTALPDKSVCNSTMANVPCKVNLKTGWRKSYSLVVFWNMLVLLKLGLHFGTIRSHTLGISRWIVQL